MNKQKPIRILCVDDHPLLRMGVAALISTQDDMQLIAEAGTGEEALEQFRTHRPDIVIMDLRLPGMSGAEATTRILEEFPAARVIALTTYEGDEDINRALEAGARAYLLKGMVRTELLNVIRVVRSGQKYIPTAISARLAENIPRNALTRRELEVLKLVADGLRNKEIGANLEIAEETVKIHVKNILEKLNVADRMQAVVSASLRGIIHLERRPPPDKSISNW